MEGFEHLEHTADVGVRAWGPTLEECFRQATLGVLDIMDAWRPGAGPSEAISVEARDLGGVLVDWLSEVLYLQDARDAVVAEVSVDQVTDTSARGTITLGPRGNVTLEGAAVKAITYHQLEITTAGGSWNARLFVDV
jgi:SHS2 domain-containing protein